MADIRETLQQRLKALEQPEGETPQETLQRAPRKQEVAQLLQDVFELPAGSEACTAQASAATSEVRAMESIKADSQARRSEAANRKKTKQAMETAKSVMNACLDIVRQDLPRYQRCGGLSALRIEVSDETKIPMRTIERYTATLADELAKLK